jgi:predicted ATPase
MLVDDGLLRRDDGRWTASGDLSQIAIPPTVNAFLSARLERLSREERGVIQRASVVGKVFWWGALAELPQAQAARRDRLAPRVRLGRGVRWFQDWRPGPRLADTSLAG